MYDYDFDHTKNINVMGFAATYKLVWKEVIFNPLNRFGLTFALDI